MKNILLILSLFLANSLLSVTTELQTVISGDVDSQTGSGVPDHTASKGTYYADKANGKVYCNVDGGTVWNNISSTRSNSLQDLRSRFPVYMPFKESLHASGSTKQGGTNDVNKKASRVGTQVNNAQGHAFGYWNLTNVDHDTYLQPTVTTANAIDWSRELALNTSFTVGAAGANGRYITWFGIDGNDAATDATALNTMGTADAIGFEVRNLDIYAVAYDGVTFTQTDTTLNAVIGQRIFITIVSNGAGTVTWYHSTDGVTYATANTESSNMPAGTSAAFDNMFITGTSATAVGAEIQHTIYEINLFFK